MTGAQTAIQLVRQCWKNSPLTPDESKQLSNAAVLGGYLAPALRLVVHELFTSSSQLNHLHLLASSPSSLPELHPDARTSYTEGAMKTRASFPNQRLDLTAGEQRRVMGTFYCKLPDPGWKRQGHYTPIKIDAGPVSADIIASIEEELSCCVVLQQAKTPGLWPCYPLRVSKNNAELSTQTGSSSDGTSMPLALACVSQTTTGNQPASSSIAGSKLLLEQEMHNELEESWNDFHSSPKATQVSAGTEMLIKEKQVRHIVTTYLYVGVCTANFERAQPRISVQ